LAAQIPQVAEVLSKDFDSYKDIMEVLLPALDKLLDDKNSDILKSACQATVSLAQILTPDDSASFLLTPMLRTLHDEDEEIRIRALITLKDLIEYISPDMCECFVVKEAMLLKSETIVKVRKAVAEMVPKIIRNLKQNEGVNKVLPIFQELAKDSIWGVRKSCVEFMPDIMESVGEDLQSSLFLPLFEELLNDKSNSVRLCAMGRLGQMIHFCKVPVPEYLLTAFLELSRNNSNKGELQLHCAYYFPAVLLKVGAGEWGKMSVSYSYIASEGDLKCIRSLVSGMHEIGKILGCEVATVELVPVFEKIYNESASSKQVAAAHLGTFLSCLIPQARINFLKYVKTMYKISANWRIRLSIAEQLVDILKLYELDMVVSELSPIVFSLAEDKIAKVRETAAPGMGYLIGLVLNNPAFLEIVTSFKALSSKSYISKQVFLLSCEHIPLKGFEQNFFNEFRSLCDEKSANLRMLCAKMIKKLRENGQSLSQLDEKLSHDFDADVRFEVTGKYDVERGVSRLRPNTKKICELMEPWLRALFPDDDLEEVIKFSTASSCGLEIIKSTFVPAMNGFVDEISLSKVARNKMLIEF